MADNHHEGDSAGAEAQASEAKFRVELRFFWCGLAGALAVLWTAYGAILSGRDVAYWEALSHDESPGWAFLERERSALDHAPVPITRSMAEFANNPRADLTVLRPKNAKAPPLLGWAHSKELEARTRGARAWQEMQNTVTTVGEPSL